MNEFLKKYLEISTTEKRISFLKENGNKDSLPISFSEDILKLNISTNEKQFVLDKTQSENNLAMEDFLLSGISIWDQNIATNALRRWADGTHHTLWHRLIPHIESKISSQRIQYTILDRCGPIVGKKLVEYYTNRNEISELSQAFQALILTRACQWGIKNDILKECAFKIIQELTEVPWPENKAIPAALAWISTFEQTALIEFIDSNRLPEHWSDLVKLYLHSNYNMTEFTKKISKLSSTKSGISTQTLLSHFPPLWLRNQLNSTQISLLLTQTIQTMKSAKEKFPFDLYETWNLFAGCSEQELEKSICNMNVEFFPQAISIVAGLIEIPFNNNILSHSRSLIHNAKNVEIFLNSLPPLLNFYLKPESNDSTSTRLKTEQHNFLNHNFAESSITFKDYPFANNSIKNWNDTDDVLERKKYFNFMYNSDRSETIQTQNFWGLLINSQIKPDIKTLNELAKLARQEPKIFQLCYIESLGYFKGEDEAILKLLDYSRSSDIFELNIVIESLIKINTQRSLQELVAYITRPNVNLDLQLKICRSILLADLTFLQSEIRSALNDIKNKPNSSETNELLEAISELIIPQTINELPASIASNSSKGEPKDLDEALLAKIPSYLQLSSEVKRALRTAQFFHTQIETVQSATVIDLSPVIDMQYKALELLFRESFEDTCFQLINAGPLQRKLDIIGYARPIPKAMDEFEKFISLLPVVKEIPFFSKFKLRKMLRAICQYRPGRRFTLDGVKAFSLFFLCFGRSQCPYGLQNMINLGFPDDTSLAAFCKELHIFQDFRNRAAHEGFHPEAHSDMDGIWRSTSQIIQCTFNIQKTLSSKVEINTRVITSNKKAS